MWRPRAPFCTWSSASRSGCRGTVPQPRAIPPVATNFAVCTISCSSPLARRASAIQMCVWTTPLSTASRSKGLVSTLWTVRATTWKALPGRWPAAATPFSLSLATAPSPISPLCRRSRSSPPRSATNCWPRISMSMPGPTWMARRWTSWARRCSSAPCGWLRASAHWVSRLATPKCPSGAIGNRPIPAS